jgi:hypothetical protein
MKIWTTRMRYAVGCPLMAIALMVASVSACGGSPSLGNSNGGDTNGGNSNGGDTVNVCMLMPSSQVAAVTGETVAQAIPEQTDSFPDPNSFLCTYYLSDGRNIQVEVETTNSPDAFAANSRGLDADAAAPAASVSGIGDKAVASADGLAALTDNDNILIGGVSGEPSWDIKLARILISALG